MICDCGQGFVRNEQLFGELTLTLALNGGSSSIEQQSKKKRLKLEHGGVCFSKTRSLIIFGVP